MKSPSSSSFSVETAVTRDDELVEFVQSIVDAARVAWPDRFVTDFNARGAPNVLYTETHYALSAVLLHLTGRGDRSLLDLAASRLRMWNDANGDKTSSTRWRYCLTAIAIDGRCGDHGGLRGRSSPSCSRRRGRTASRRHGLTAATTPTCSRWPSIRCCCRWLAAGRSPTWRARNVCASFASIGRPKASSSTFRASAPHELLCPPTYIMKMLFLVGICHELHPIRARSLFIPGWRRCCRSCRRRATSATSGGQTTRLLPRA